MLFTRYSFLLIALLAALGSNKNAVAQNDTDIVPPTTNDFTEIADVPQTPTSIITPNSNPCGVLVTIEPADTVTIKTNPPDLVLVTASTSGNVLTYSYNSAVLDGTSQGGIIIGMPADQLTSVSARGVASVQITDGFTSITSISASGNWPLDADLSSNTPVVTLTISGNGQATVVGGTYTGSVSGNGNTNVQGNWNSLSISGNGGATIEGNVTNPSISGNGGVTINGNIVDGGNKSGNGGLSLSGTVTSGTFSASGNGGITASSCDNINTSGNGGCNTGTVSPVPITFVEQDTISEKRTGWGCGSRGSGAACNKKNAALSGLIAVVAAFVAL